MSEQEKVFDLAIVGCGPAGLSAAVNADVRNLDFVLLGSDFCSPKLDSAPEINNYLGFRDISGNQLRQNFINHVQEMGIEIKNDKVDNIYDQGEHYTLLARDDNYSARALILAVGVSNEDYLEGEERLVGRGVSYCATCDGPLYKNKDVAVIAYTEEGLEEVDYLNEIADTVYLIPDDNMEDAELTGLDSTIINKKPTAITGDNLVEGVKFVGGDEIEVDGVFIFRKVTPPDKLMNGLNTRDSHIEVNSDFKTNLDGVFAAGDCIGRPYQLGKAVGEGQIAALNAASYLR